MVESAEAGLALLDSTSTGSKTNCKKKPLAKAEKAPKSAKAKTPETESETKEAKGVTKVTKDTMKAGFQADLEKAKKAVEDAKGTMTAAASQMFAFYLNLLSPESKYSWNKIISEQAESNLFVNQQGVSLESPRGMYCKLFSNCIMFHLLTAFPINVAEQKKYYITNVLKKPQCVNVRHLYVVKSSSMPTSPRYHASTTRGGIDKKLLYQCKTALHPQSHSSPLNSGFM